MSTTITPENAPSTVAELITLGRFNIRMLAQKLGIFDKENEAEKTAFLGRPIEDQAQQVVDALAEVRGEKKAKKAPAAVRTPVHARPPKEEEEEEEGTDEEEGTEEEEEEEETDEEEEEAPKVVTRTPVTKSKPAKPPASVQCAPAAAAPGAAGEQLVNAVKALQADMTAVKEAVRSLTTVLTAVSGSLTDNAKASSLAVSLTLKVAEEVLQAGRDDIMLGAIEDCAQIMKQYDQRQVTTSTKKPKGK